ncbi:MAG: hypothetical protein OHK93_006123 [Ramalina farinacea]|uniref:Annexin n=1 Tax=Ramalina farinacea TaxID=258253 RepID=A0AA43QHX3_9LECA|nr:hypothetical protein [Ramalina farinacea]
MSLRVDGHSRGRSRSPGRKDERSRSRDARAPSPSVQVVIKSEKSRRDDDSDSGKLRKKHSKSKKYESSSDSESDSRSKHKKSSKKRYESSSSDSEPDPRHKKHSSRQRYSDSDSDPKSKRKAKKYYDDDSDSASSSSSSSSEDDRRSRHKKESPKKDSHKSSKSHHDHNKHDKHDKHSSHSREKQYTKDAKGERVLVMPGSFAPPQYVVAQPENRSGRASQYAQMEPYQYATNERKVSYTAQPQFPEAKPSNRRTSSPPSMHRLSVSGGSLGAGLVPGGSRHGSMSGGLPPGSPLLEAYRGTYQSISPMPSPLMLASKDDSDLSDLSPLDEDSDLDEDIAHHSKSKKKVSFYNAEADALALAGALKHSTINPKPLIKILPHLSDDHVLELRKEYKLHMKAQGKGVNIAKHIKMKVPGNLGKAAYAVALGRWESEAHWANFWYQSNSSRRELLIESLMGRSNSDIVKIKDAFSDQRYNNSLEKCMEAELKGDKFKTAVMLVLDEKRMSESEKLDMSLVRKDVEHLYRALTTKEGSETAMIKIIVVRSDKHLAEVMRLFDAMYKKNFAREMIKRSQNLVGETLAHILNGVLNRPVRDALLLHQALAETSKDRTELLVSRLVRFHWEPKHLERVKAAYRQKYANRLEEDIADGTKGDFREFVKQLCRVES